MVNSNPETVSHRLRHVSDHLFFEPLTVEDVLNICDRDAAEGRDRAVRRADAAEPGARRWRRPACRSSAPASSRIDIAEDRERFQALVERARPEAAGQRHRPATCSRRCTSARQIGFPVLVRPSFVLGGRAMEIVYDEDALTRYVDRALDVVARQAGPDRQVPGVGHRGGRRLPVATAQRTVIGGVMQHIEEAGIHSGDSACVIPPHSLPADGHRRDQAADARAGRWR